MIRAEGLSKQFDDFWAVQGVSLEVRPGETLALLGPNGAGKTTTVRMLAAILRPDRGRAWVAGFDVTAAPDAVRARVGLLTEHHGLYRRMTGEEYLRFFGRLYGLTDPLLSERVAEWLRYFDLWDARERRIGGYSKGMRQKLALARALLHDPPVLILDEPTSAMDPESAQRVRHAIAALQEQGRTILMCTHNLQEAERLAGRIAIIYQGRIIAQGTLEELKSRYLGAPTFHVELGRSLNGAFPALPPGVEIEAWGENWIRYRTASWSELNPRVVTALVQQGYPVVRVEEVPRSLEQVYLRVVGEAYGAG